MWNQLCENGNFADVSSWLSTNASYSVAENIATINKPSTGKGVVYKNITIDNGHTYYYAGTLKSSDGVVNISVGFLNQATGANIGRLSTTNTVMTFLSGIITIQEDGLNFGIRFANSNIGTAYAQNVMLIDLTQMFGAGNEPSTPEEFEAMFPLPYYAYNTGILINNKATAIQSKNENGDVIDVLNLNLNTITGKIDGVGESVVINPEGVSGTEGWADIGVVENGYLTKIIKNTSREAVDLGTLTYLVSSAVENAFVAAISGMKGVDQSSMATTFPPVICPRYFTVAYNDRHDKCITYRQVTEASGCTGIMVIDSSFAGYSPEQVAAALSGVYITFQLANSVTYVLDRPIRVRYKVVNQGTEERLPLDISNLVSAPFVGKIEYPSGIDESTLHRIGMIVE